MSDLGFISIRLRILANFNDLPLNLKHIFEKKQVETVNSNKKKWKK